MKAKDGVTNISKIQSESNSQQNRTWRTKVRGVTNISKIQSESNSQQVEGGIYLAGGCDQYFKDTI